MKKLTILFAIIFPMFLFSQSRELDIDVQDWKLYAPLGLLDSVQVFNKFGVNYDIDGGTTDEDVWAAGGIFPLHTTADSIIVTSSSDVDSIGNAGCLTVILEGVNASGSYVVDTVIMVGTNNDTTDVEFMYVNEAYCDTGGSNKTNAGNITLTHKDDATTVSYILAGKGKSHQAIYAVPINETLLLTNAFYSINSPATSPSTSPSGDIGLFYLDSYIDSDSVWREIGGASVKAEANNFIDYKYTPFLKAVGGSLVKLTVTSSIEDNQIFAAELDGYLIKSNAVTRQGVLDGLNMIPTFGF